MTEQDIFVEAVQITDPASRAAFLDRACGGDPALRGRVAGLLAVLGRAGDFLGQPAVVAADPDATRGVEAGGPAEAVGTVIGPYTLLEVIGEGGMGVVYAAEQKRPVRRKVAVKVVKPGMDSAAVLARFEAERQALALMDHPHIARVLDAGATEAGRPYFVMELVRGLPVTDYCDQTRLPIPDRLRLFADVCRAVQHAHTKGVIHRDLKPSNVLVTVVDGRPVPKVIDFGIAKAAGAALTDRTLHTGHFQLVGTPLYMAPEQAELSGVDVDTRADVYSLGVLLYELLTGTTPFTAEALQRAGFDEMRRILREDEPARPSRRVSTLDAQQSSTVAGRRGVDARRLGRVVRGELDWVVMRALEKDRGRRYQSPAELAADVDRFLAGAAVAAAPPSALYRVQKIARRNRPALAAAAVLAVAGAAVGWAALDRADNRQAAAARRSAVELAAATALDESAEHYRADRPEAAMAAARRAVDVLAGVPGTEVAEAVARERVVDFEMVARLEAAWMDPRAGGSGLDGRAAAARRRFAEYGLDVAELSEHEAVGRIAGKLVAPDLVAGLDGWAGERRVVHGPADPLAAKLRAVATAADPDPWSRRVRDTVLAGTPDQMAALAAELPIETAGQASVDRLGKALKRAGRRAEAEGLHRRAARAHPAHFRPPFSLGDLLSNARSEATRVEALGFYRVALALRPQSTEVLNRIGLVLTDRLNRPADGADLFREAIRRWPDNVLARQNLVVALGKQGKHEEAVAAARAAVAAVPSTTTYGRLGVALKLLGRRDEAREAYRAAVGCEPRTADDYAARGNALSELGRGAEAAAAYREAVRLNPEHLAAWYNLGNELRRAGADGEARAAYQAALAVMPDYPPALNGLGLLHAQRGELEPAVAAYRAAIDADPDNAAYHDSLATGLSQLGRRDEAIVAYREAIRLRPAFANAHYNLARVLAGLDRTDEAIAAYQTAIQHNPSIAEAHCNLAGQLKRQGRYADALDAYRRGHELGRKQPGWAYPSAEWVEGARRLVALGPRVEAVLTGGPPPPDPADGVQIAGVASDRKLYLRAAQLYRAAFAADPQLGSDQRIGRLYSAACAATRVGTDPSAAGDDVRARWRRQALDWLRAELAANQQAANESPAERRQARSRLEGWRTSSALAGVRDAAGLATLPAVERAEWERLWADHRSTLVGPTNLAK